MEETYYLYRKKRRNTRLRLIIMWYMMFVILHALVISYGVRVVRVNKDEQGLFAEYPQGQKVLVLSLAYGIKLFSKKNFKQWNPLQKGDIVLVKQQTHTPISMTRKTIYKILNMISIGIIRLDNTLVFRIVAATAGDTIYYSLSQLPQAMPIQSYDKQITEVSYFDTEKTMTIPPREVFLVGEKPYEIDSRVSGTYKYTDVLGKAIMLLGPAWGAIPVQTLSSNE